MRLRIALRALVVCGFVYLVFGIATSVSAQGASFAGDDAAVLNIDLTQASTHVATVTIQLEFSNDSSDPRQLLVSTTAPFPIAVVSLEDHGHEDDGDYTLAAVSGASVSSSGTQLVRDIAPMDPGDPPLRLDVEIELTLLEGGGVLAPEGSFPITFAFGENANPVELDFSEFFGCIDDPNHPRCLDGWSDTELDFDPFFDSLPEGD